MKVTHKPTNIRFKHDSLYFNQHTKSGSISNLNGYQKTLKNV